MLIVGGGAVAGRKAASLGGSVRVLVVAPTILGTFAPSVAVRRKPYEADDLIDADLVFAATDSPAVNDAVVRDCRRAKIWCNRVDDGGDLPGDFTAAARFDIGPVTVTVNAGSAGLSAVIRDKLSTRFEPTWADMAAAMVDIRPLIKSRWRDDPAARRAAFQELTTDEAFSILSTRGRVGLENWLFDVEEQ